MAFIAAAIVAVVLATACSASPTVIPNPSQLAPATMPSPDATPTTGASPVPGGQTPAPVTPVPSKPATARPSPSLVARRSADEESLYLSLRPDARVRCEPRRSGLPARAIAGIECHVGSALVDRVGAYLLEDESAAALTYLERMDAAGALVDSGDCRAGTPHDGAYQGFDGDVDPDQAQVLYRNKLYSIARDGCFLNESGTANFRATCYDGLYIGVLGTTTALASLSAWALAPPSGEEMGDSPGICFGALGGGLGPDSER